MDIYQISVDLKPGVRDTRFLAALETYLGALKADGRIEGWRLLRRKLGLGMPGLGEFQILIETRDLTQLDAAFTSASRRERPPTPENEKKWRAVQEPGARIRHPGLVRTAVTLCSRGEVLSVAFSPSPCGSLACWLAAPVSV